MAIKLAHWVVLAALTLKVVSNLILPYRVLKLPEEEGLSIGFLLLGDAFLFTLAVTLGWAATGSGPLYEAGRVAAVAGGGIFGSYVHYFVVLMANEWLQRHKGDGDSGEG